MEEMARLHAKQQAKQCRRAIHGDRVVAGSAAATVDDDVFEEQP